MAGEITNQPTFVTTGETQDTTTSGPPPNTVSPKSMPVVSGLSEVDTVSATPRAQGPALTDVHFKDQPKSTPGHADPTSTKPDPVYHHETTHVVIPDGPSIGEIAVQSTKDHCNKVMNDMLDASIKSAHENVLKAIEHDKKTRPGLLARQERIDREESLKARQAAEAGQMAADNRLT